MTNIEYIKSKLISNRENFKEIAYKTELTERTLHNIATGSHGPSATTLTKLVNYFKRRERKK